MLVINLHQLYPRNKECENNEFQNFFRQYLFFFFLNKVLKKTIPTKCYGYFYSLKGYIKNYFFFVIRKMCVTEIRWCSRRTKKDVSHWRNRLDKKLLISGLPRPSRPDYNRQGSGWWRCWQSDRARWWDWVRAKAALCWPASPTMVAGGRRGCCCSCSYTCAHWAVSAGRTTTVCLYKTACFFGPHTSLRRCVTELWTPRVTAGRRERRWGNRKVDGIGLRSFLRRRDVDAIHYRDHPRRNGQT